MAITNLKETPSKLPVFNQPVLIFIDGKDEPEKGWLVESTQNKDGVTSTFEYYGEDADGVPDTLVSQKVIAWQPLPKLK